MSFRESLEKIVLGTEGGVAAVVMALDGIAVESYTRDGADVDIGVYGAEVAAILGTLRGTSSVSLSSGRVEELDLYCERFHAVVRFLSDEYFAVIALRPGANVGKGRYLLRVAMPDLVSEL
jgi:predicted regulator of Ras-like GTPase activity (Roadblock/LC7/MglB family)